MEKEIEYLKLEEVRTQLDNIIQNIRSNKDQIIKTYRVFFNDNTKGIKEWKRDIKSFEEALKEIQSLKEALKQEIEKQC